MFGNNEVVAFENRLEYWAACLDWNHLKRFESGDISPPFIWYESGNATGRWDHVALHISVGRYPTENLRAAVYAIRYRLMSGWHNFTLLPERDDIEREAERLAGWLHNRWFSNTLSRREYRVQHPECVGYTWRRLHVEGEPTPKH